MLVLLLLAKFINIIIDINSILYWLKIFFFLTESLKIKVSSELLNFCNETFHEKVNPILESKCERLIYISIKIVTRTFFKFQILDKLHNFEL